MGCVITGANVANDTIITSGITLSIATLASIPPGIWLLSFNAFVYPNGNVTTTGANGVRYNISTALNTFNGGTLLIGSEPVNYVNPASFPNMSGIACVTITSTTTYYLNVTISFTGDIRVSTTNLYFKATRMG